jgi:cell division protein FtsI/penicillin-binding protein 2
MEAHEALERFEHSKGGHHHGGAPEGLARNAAVVVAVVAAFLAIATFLGNEAVKDAIQQETQVADARAQAATFDTQVLIFESDQLLLAAQTGSSDTQLAQTAKTGLDEINKSQKEIGPQQKKLAKETKDHKAEVKKNNDQHLLYEIAEVLLQIAIVLASVSIIASRRFLLFGGGSLAAIGVVVLVIGFVK